MKSTTLSAAGAVALVLGLAAAAEAQWGSGWGWGNGSGGGYGRTEGPVAVDLWQSGESASLSVTVSGCGGVRDFRSFGSDVANGDGQSADAAAALTRLLGEARRVCGFEPRLATRIEDGFAAAFDAWLEEQTGMNYMDMNEVDMNMAIECDAEDCNAM